MIHTGAVAWKRRRHWRSTHTPAIMHAANSHGTVSRPSREGARTGLVCFCLIIPRQRSTQKQSLPNRPYCSDESSQSSRTSAVASFAKYSGSLLRRSSPLETHEMASTTWSGQHQARKEERGALRDRRTDNSRENTPRPVEQLRPRREDKALQPASARCICQSTRETAKWGKVGIYTVRCVRCEVKLHSNILCSKLHHTAKCLH